MARQERQAHRLWWQDALSAAAFFALSYYGGRLGVRLLGLLGGLFLFAIPFGLGYYFSRAAWRGFLETFGDGNR